MNSHTPAIEQYEPEFRASSPRAAIPSWLLSLALHAVLLYFFATHMATWGDGSLASAEGDFREVGIYVRPENDARETVRQDEPSAAEQSIDNVKLQPNPSPVSPQSIVSDQPPVPLTTPSTSAPSIIGSGPPAPMRVPTSVSQLPMSSGSMFHPSKTVGLGPGTTTFFGVKDKGSRLVYVIDCSGSMLNHQAIRVAKAELMASLESLERTQQFQIIFYNTKADLMTIAGREQDKLYWATDVNRRLAQNYISSVQADSGTDHMPALRLALSLSPEVIFFLTDADQPQLSDKQLSDIRQLNGGRSRIHCIEFGAVPELDRPNFLKKLAQQNGGGYRYRDVTAFEGTGQ